MKKLFFLIMIVTLTLVSCSEEELVIEGNSDTDEVVIDDGNNNNSDGSVNDGNHNNYNCDNANSNEVAIVNEILNLVNDHRQSIGKSVLDFSCVATELAIEHTEYMIAQNDISHDGFQARFQELQQRLNAKSASENVASGYSSAQSVMDAWLASEGHRANIEGNFTHIGIAAIRNSQDKLYYTQLFYR